MILISYRSFQLHVAFCGQIAVTKTFLDTWKKFQLKTWNMKLKTRSEYILTKPHVFGWNFLKVSLENVSFTNVSKEAHKNGAAGDVLCFVTNRVFAFAASKSLNSKWKPVQHHVRTLPELKSTWFYIIEKFLEFDEKKVGNALKIASEGALWSFP